MLDDRRPHSRSSHPTHPAGKGMPLPPQSVDLPGFMKPAAPPVPPPQSPASARQNPTSTPELPAFLSGNNKPDRLVSPYPADYRPSRSPQAPGTPSASPGRIRAIPRQKPRAEKIRNQRPYGRQASAPGYGSSLFGFDQMTRKDALYRVRGYLKRNPGHPHALRLIDLFQLHPEELSEIGVPYEILKSLRSVYTL